MVSESIWDHPCDEHYRSLYEREKNKHAGSKGSKGSGTDEVAVTSGISLDEEVAKIRRMYAEKLKEVEEEEESRFEAAAAKIREAREKQLRELERLNKDDTSKTETALVRLKDAENEEEERRIEDVREQEIDTLAAAVEKIKENTEARLLEEKTAHEAKISDLRDQLDSELEDHRRQLEEKEMTEKQRIRAEHDRRLAAVRRDMDAELRRAESALQDGMEQETITLRVSLEREFEERKASIREAHEHRADQLERERTRALDDLRARQAIEAHDDERRELDAVEAELATRRRAADAARAEVAAAERDVDEARRRVAELRTALSEMERGAAEALAAEKARARARMDEVRCGAGDVVGVGVTATPAAADIEPESSSTPSRTRGAAPGDCSPAVPPAAITAGFASSLPLAPLQDQSFSDASADGERSLRRDELKLKEARMFVEKQKELIAQAKKISSGAAAQVHDDELLARQQVIRARLQAELDTPAYDGAYFAHSTEV
ncbi:hypothetical protein HK405_003534 [Cladochytrium tenue]|nr:hypothetical protein HK405_003534 [Cladochytrium tenue]